MSMRRDWSHAMDDPEYFAREDAEWGQPRHTAYFEAIAEWITPGIHSLVDVGCGSGIGLRVWQRRVPHVVGVDASVNCVRMARERNPASVVLEMDVRALRIETDALVATAFLKHFPVLGWESMLRRFGDIARQRMMVGIQLGETGDGDDPEFWHSSMPRADVEQLIATIGWRIVGEVDVEPTEPVFIMERA